MQTAKPSRKDYQSLLTKNAFLTAQVQEQTDKVLELEEALSEVQSRLDWFNRQVFSKTSEKFFPVDVAQLELFEQKGIAEKEPEGKKIAGYTRKPRGKTEDLGDNTASGLRFDDAVEIVLEDIYPKEIEGLSEDEYDEIGQEISDRLGSRTSKTFVHRRVFHKIKLKESEHPSEEVIAGCEVAEPPTIVKSEVPAQVIQRSYMAVSFIVDMLLDKALYSMPLYRQHMRLKYDGIYLSRATLSNNFIRACSLLKPVVDAQRLSILLSHVLAIDETPMNVGVNRKKHKMNKGYIWPIYGDRDEIVYNYNKSRAAIVIKELLGEFHGTLLSDGYSAYKSYVKGVCESDLEGSVTHASCWVHARRQFVKLENTRPVEYERALSFIAKLYKIEQEAKDKSKKELHLARQEHSLPMVDEYFEWLRSFDGQSVLATNKKLRLAISYSLEREQSMRVFLRDSDVQLDTNHLEREIRPIAIGRKNWTFCWTEVGAESLCIAQSLVRTCLLQGVNPRDYLIDVLQRLTMERAENEDVSDLVPRLWKDSFAKDPIPCPAEQAIKVGEPNPVCRYI